MQIINKYFIFFMSLLLFSCLINITNNDEVISAINYYQPNTNDQDSTPIENVALPSKIYSVKEVMKDGRKITKNYLYKDLNWIRPSYKEYWNQEYGGGRWSNVNTLMNYAYHRIFTEHPTASIQYDFMHYLGIFDLNFKYPKNYSIFDIKLVVMNASIIDIKTLGNQVVVVHDPLRKGINILLVNHKEINPINYKEPIMFQLVTPDGYEIDYSLFILDSRIYENNPQ